MVGIRAKNNSKTINPVCMIASGLGLMGIVALICSYMGVFRNMHIERDSLENCQ